MIINTEKMLFKFTEVIINRYNIAGFFSNAYISQISLKIAHEAEPSLLV